LIKQSDYENYDYRQFWQDDKRLYEDSAERIVIKKFIGPLEKQGRVFVDLGCGFGRLFSEYKDFEKIILVDYSVNNLKNAREAIEKFLNYDKALMKKVVYVAADVVCLPFISSFADVAMTVRVMHHIENVEKFINEASRILKPGGYFLVEFANKRNLKNILKFMFGRLKQSPFDIRPLQIGATILDYHPKFIKSLLRQTGFKILKQVSASNYRLGFLKRHVNLKVLLFFEGIYQNIFSFIDTGPSIFLKTINSAPQKSATGLTDSITPMAEVALTGLNHKKTIDSFEDSKTYFCCPECRQENLEIDSGGKIICTSCKREFYMDDGIYIFK